MASVNMTLNGYMCEPCAKDGVAVQALVRMYPHAMWAGDNLILDHEFLCCPRCFNPVAKYKDKMRLKPPRKKAAKPEPHTPKLQVVK